MHILPAGLRRRTTTTRPGVVASWLLVVGISAAVLKGLDRIPALVLGTPQGAQSYATVREAEAALAARLWMPAYYPDTLAWPPAGVEAWPGPPPVVVIRVNARNGRQGQLVIAQSVDGPADPPAALLPRDEVLERAEVAVGRHEGTLLRLLAPDGTIRHELSWTEGPRRIVLRFAGSVEQLSLMAESLERMHR